ncbi:MAG: GNAT family N-acetyltransferase [Deltaproteobacteria bacterium]|nr:GNAT family N-acetyltransferase [Deltaproteobacteria bacterium]
MTSKLHVRTASASDVPRLVAMNVAAYPELVADGVVFDESQLRAQQYVFPEGQLVVEREGEVVGALATLIARGEAALAQHTWIDATSHGTFACHDPDGDTLYLADVYVDPAARGLGVGAKLYEALFALCRRKRLARVVGGGRLFGYHEVAKTMSPEAYVGEVLRGERRDLVLGSQLSAGFRVEGIFVDYLDDWRSAGFATKIVWRNPSAEKRVDRGSGLSPRSDAREGDDLANRGGDVTQV